MGLGGDTSRAGEDAVDGRYRRDRGVAFLGQVPGDGVGPGIVAGGGEFVAQCEDAFGDGGCDGGGAGVGPGGVGFYGVEAAVGVAVHQFADPAGGYAEAFGGLGVGDAGGQDGGDDDAVGGLLPCHGPLPTSGRMSRYIPTSGRMSRYIPTSGRMSGDIGGTVTGTMSGDIPELCPGI